MGWLGADVWMAHGVHLNDADIAKIGRDRHGRSRTARRPTPASPPASPPSGTCATAGVPVGLGVDGAASNESGSTARHEVRHALLIARPAAARTR